MKLTTIVGARPQFVKAAMVSAALGRHSNVNEVLVHTGQHYDHAMSQVFLDQLGLPVPRYNLGIGSGDQGLQTGRMMEGIERVLLAEHPDLTLVYGDTNSTLAGALAAAKLHIPVAHVEAGLRSFDRRMPEEINRVVTDHVSNLLLAPTDTAVNNLGREGISEQSVRLVGDVMFDAALRFAEAAAESKILEKAGLVSGQYILATVHRAENTDSPERLAVIMSALRAVSETIPVVLPLHPRTRKVLSGTANANGRLILIDPAPYLDMIQLERNARLIATDSGGVQKEAFFYRVPCVTLREHTEWVELVELGWNRLAPPFRISSVIAALEERLDARPQTNASPYGDGQAADHIADALLELGRVEFTNTSSMKVAVESDGLHACSSISTH